MSLPHNKREVLRATAALALHPATPSHEADAAAMGFFRILRNANVTAEQLVNGSIPAGPPPQAAPPPPRPWKKRSFYTRRPDGEFAFGFGRHQDQPLREVPLSYLRWVLKEISGMPEELVAALKKELDRRHGYGGF